MSKSLVISICALAAILVAISLTTATLRVDREKVLFNQCTGRLISLRSAILLYTEQRGEFPQCLTNLAPEYVHPSLLFCPKLFKAGSSVNFVYRRPASATATNRWLLRSPRANYL